MAIEYSEANAGTGGTKFAHDNITEGVNTLAVPYTKLMSGTDGDKSVIPCDSVNGLDVDVTRVSGNTGTTTQPISGTVNANQSGSWSVTNLGSGKSLKLAAVSLTTTGTIVPAVSGKRIKVYRYAIQGRNDGVTLQFRDGSAGSSLSIEWIFNAREGVSSGSVSPPEFLFGTSAGNSLDGVVTGIGTVWVEVSYFDDDAS